MSNDNHDHKFQDIKEAFAYTFAGKAVITLESHKTNNHITYKVRQAKDNNQLFFVSVLGNNGEFHYLGIVTPKGFRLTARSTAGEDAQSVKVFRWFYALKELPWNLNIHHEGKCGHCGRSLTVPGSIQRGIGPECAKRVKIAPVVPIEEMHTMWNYDN